MVGGDGGVGVGVRFFENYLDMMFADMRVYFLNAGCEVYSLRFRWIVLKNVWYARLVLRASLSRCMAMVSHARVIRQSCVMYMFMAMMNMFVRRWMSGRV